MYFPSILVLIFCDCASKFCKWCTHRKHCTHLLYLPLFVMKMFNWVLLNFTNQHVWSVFCTDTCFSFANCEQGSRNLTSKWFELSLQSLEPHTLTSRAETSNKIP